MLNYVPISTLSILETYIAHYQSLHHWEMYWPFLKYRILTTSATELAQIGEVEEGIENRLIENAKHSSSFQQFMTLMKTKRYTWTRIQRICIHILTHCSKEEIQHNSFPTYLRLLGMTGNRSAILTRGKKRASSPVHF